MASKWQKAKIAMGLKMCLYAPSTLEDSLVSVDSAGRFSDAGLLSPAARKSDCRFEKPTTPTPSSSGLRLSKHDVKSSQRTCAICLTTMKPGQGHAIFTAECSHSFHFHCITSNVKHGNQICPICRAKWKEIPLRSPASDLSCARARISPAPLRLNDAWMAVSRGLPSPRADADRQLSSLLRASEPTVFDDDELLDPQAGITGTSSSNELVAGDHSFGAIKIDSYPEVLAVSKSASHNNFSILIHIKAPHTRRSQNHGLNQANSTTTASQNSRAPVDLVTVLDVSGSMAGTKLALLKRAMGFVIQHLGPSDRLSVIAFSSTARRLFPLRRMTDTGRQEALQAVNGLISNGGTNIAEGLKKGAKVIVDRKSRNPVSSIILLSDGQDTYTVTSPGGSHPRSDYQSLLPVSIHRNGGTGLHVPVHAFGFGADHDAEAMHSISEISGGTFSFIEAENVIQDAFAQCIGGLLSVVVQELKVKVDCVHPMLRLSSIKAGNYKTSIASDERTGLIDVGDLYAEEERDFLVAVDIPIDLSSNEMSLLKVGFVYREAITKDTVKLEEANEVKIQRPEVTGQVSVSMEVDRQRNRLRAAEAIAEARTAAEQSDLPGAVSILERCRNVLLETVSAQGGDRLCIALGAELREMQERMANRRVYEASGRAYVLSGLSSHSWQRATARGDSTDSTSLMQAYQTPSMVDMVTQSQTMIFDNAMPRPPVRKVMSFPARPHAR